MAEKKQKPCDCPPPGAPAWMSTFSDLCTLLLTFFVLLLTMATFEPTKFAMTAQSLQGAFGVMESFPTVAIHPVVKIPKKSGDEQKKKESLQDAQKVKEVIESKQLEDAVKVEVTEKGMAIMLRDPVGFTSGSAELKAKGKDILADISDIIKSNENIKVRVEGHTDDVPISGRYSSNWELSTARSLSVVKLMSEYTGINPANMSASGYGEFRPMVPNSDSKNRAMNRRIKIFVDYINNQEE